ncbi:MAG: dihydrolipoyl dehydrogenase [Pelodictyon luteolum]|uniref:Dihydrolipoyl dehydrogenase n=1 Tax=Pelodictyon luteolum TaxID=1100 RepID=A0A165LTP9_PELLU|nr:dihydrolipoyl dehydrogenase [Pelodictyon luteolum]KZK74418.1 MAG: dihydrolipoyl dehydrogenase [Pelodictyon luteolum]
MASINTATPLPASRKADVAVIGSGPGGYEAALLAARMGMQVTLIEKSALGGVCVNWGCIPTKALLRSAEAFDLLRKGEALGLSAREATFELAAAVKRSRTVVLKISKGIEYRLRKAGVEVVQGEARFAGPNELEVIRDGAVAASISASSIIVATGGRMRTILGLEPDQRLLITSREALAMKELPASMIVLGGGAIGVELAWFYATLGTRVTIVEMMERLMPLEDSEISEALKRSFQKAGITVATGSKLEDVKKDGGRVTARLMVPGEEPQEIEAELMLLAVGVGGSTEGLRLERAGVGVSRGFIETDARCRTAVAHIYAIGDVRGGMLLAHKASAEAAIAVASIAGTSPEPLDDTMIPRCVYAEPSIASIGMSEEQALQAGRAVSVGRSNFAASGKANAYGNLEGLVKLVFEAGGGPLLGAHLIGHGAVELIGELALARSLGVTASRLASVVHAHPTLSESIREAALVAQAPPGA